MLPKAMRYFYGEQRIATPFLVHQDGTIQRIDGKPVRILTNRRYPSICWYSSKRRFTKSNGSIILPVHRMVAETFIWNQYGKPFVNHKDGNKHNNHVDNLEWCTPKENDAHAMSLGIKYLHYLECNW